MSTILLNSGPTSTTTDLSLAHVCRTTFWPKSTANYARPHPRHASPTIYSMSASANLSLLVAQSSDISSIPTAIVSAGNKCCRADHGKIPTALALMCKHRFEKALHRCGTQGLVRKEIRKHLRPAMIKSTYYPSDDVLEAVTVQVTKKRLEDADIAGQQYHY